MIEANYREMRDLQDACSERKEGVEKIVNMFKYLGIDPPPPKKKKCDNDTKEANKVYDNTKRKRKVQPAWKDEFK